MRRPPFSARGRSFVVLLLVLALAGWAASLAAASEAVVLVPGGSKVFLFDNMRRVALIDPQVADVIVASKTELILFGKSVGVTKLYVWDTDGRHEYAINVKGRPSAELLVERLRDLLPSCLQVKALGDQTILVRGTCKTDADRTKAADIIKKVVGDVKTIDLVNVAGDDQTPAERTAAELRKIMGDDYDYDTWGDKTVIVRGPMSDEKMAELTKIKAGLGSDVNVVLVPSNIGATPPPLEEIAQAIGPEYKVWMLANGSVVVEGQAESQDALNRVKALLQAFQDKANIVDLVTLAPPPKMTAQQCADMLKGAVGKNVTVRPVGESTLMVDGTVPDDDAMKRLNDLTSAVAGNDVRVINTVTVVAPDKQRILVHVKVVDLSDLASKNFGVDWGQIAGGGYTGQPFAVQLEGGINNLNPFGVNLEALQQKNLAKILAEPNLVVNDGEQASILVGGQVPIPVVQPGGGGGGFAAVTIQYKQYGVNLKVQPKITSDGMININVNPEVSTLDYTNAVQVSGFLIPGLSSRQAQTTVTMRPGGTLVIGGLIRNDVQKSVKEIPLLAKLPIIGEFFKSHVTSQTKDELVIFLSPEILPPDSQKAQK